MKSKIPTVILLCIVLVIWGILAKQIFFDSEKIPMEMKGSSDKTWLAPIGPKDTFELNLDYRDPFLPIATIKDTPPVVRPPEQRKIVPKKRIAYQGSIGDIGSQGRLYFVSIDGKPTVLKPGMAIDGVELIRGGSAQVWLKLDGQVKSFLLSDGNP